MRRLLKAQRYYLQFWSVLSACMKNFHKSHICLGTNVPGVTGHNYLNTQSSRHIGTNLLSALENFEQSAEALGDNTN